MISFLYELFSACEHALEDAARPQVVGIFDIIYAVAGDALVGLASPLLAALLEGVDADVGDLEGHLDLFDFVGGTAYVVAFVERVDNDQLGLEILSRVMITMAGFFGSV